MGRFCGVSRPLLEHAGANVPDAQGPSPCQHCAMVPVTDAASSSFIPREKVTVKKATVKSCTLPNVNPQGAPGGPQGAPCGPPAGFWGPWGAPGAPWGPPGAPRGPLGPPGSPKGGPLGGPWGLKFGKVQDLTVAFLTVTFSLGMISMGAPGGAYVGAVGGSHSPA